MSEQYGTVKLGNGLGDNNGMSWTCNYCKVVGAQEIEISKEDRVILRKYASRVAEIAQQEKQRENQRLWTAHNDGRPERPLVFADPENAWYELIPYHQLECSGTLARIFEFRLRKDIYWAETICDDRVVSDVFTVHYIFEQTSFGMDTGVRGGTNGGSYKHLAPLKEYDQMGLLRHRRLIVDYEKTSRLYALARNVFEGILRVSLEGSWWWSFGLTIDLLSLRGMENMLYDFYEHPDELHMLMAFLRDDYLMMLDQLVKEDLLTSNNGGDFIGTGGYGWCTRLPVKQTPAQKVSLMDMWGFAESQETVNVSPAHFEEFVLPYQLPFLEKFGLNIYGCCEPLDKRMDLIERIPRLARVTVSPWSNTRIMAERIQGKYIYSWKMNPACISGNTINRDAVRSRIAQVLHDAKECGCRPELLMRDILTLSCQPQNIIDWTRIALEEAMRF